MATPLHTFLREVADRLVILGDNENADFIHRLRAEADLVEVAEINPMGQRPLEEIRKIWNSKWWGHYKIETAANDVHALRRVVDDQARTIKKYQEAVEEARRSLRGIYAAVAGMRGRVDNMHLKTRELYDQEVRAAHPQTRNYHVDGDPVWCPECMHQWVYGEKEAHHQDCTHVGGLGYRQTSTVTLDTKKPEPTTDGVTCDACGMGYAWGFTEAGTHAPGCPLDKKAG